MKTRYKLLLLFAVLSAGFFLGNWYSSHTQYTASAKSALKIIHYICPMHPQYVSDHSGDCPSCGMRLEPVYEGGNSAAQSQDPNMPAGTVKIGLERQQLIGLRTGRVEMTKGAHIIRILGRVAPDETRIYRLTASTDGWIVETMPNTVGSLVKKNEILATFYSPEFLGSEQAYIYALNSLARFKASADETPQQIQLTKANAQQYIDTLKNQGMSDLQIEEIGQERLLTQSIYLVSPTAGFILRREVSPGLRFERGLELYRIADLRKVWILADLFGKEAEFVRPGLKARAHFPDNPEREFQAQVSKVLPQFDPTTRTMKVRLEVDNPDFALRPDMFVDVEFPVEMAPSLSVPADAVIDTGRRKTVFVDKGDGHFEPRRVETGWRMSGRIEIKSGLMEGERIITSGNFLVDSESQMKLAAAGSPNDYSVDPVCGMEVDPNKVGITKSEYRGQTFYFCSSQCKSKFDKNQGMYAGRLAMPKEMKPAVAGSPAAMNMEGSDSRERAKMEKDPVCNMDVDLSTHDVIKTEYQGKTYYFCSELCKKSFKANPGKYALSKSMAAQDKGLVQVSE